MDNFNTIFDGESLEERLKALEQCFQEIEEDYGASLANIASHTKDFEVFEWCIEKIRQLEESGFLLANCSFNVPEAWAEVLYPFMEKEQDFGDFAINCKYEALAKKALEQVKSDAVLAEIAAYCIGVDTIAELALARIQFLEYVAWVAVSYPEEKIKVAALQRLGVSSEQAFEMVENEELLEKLVQDRSSEYRLRALYKIKNREFLERLYSFYLDEENPSDFSDEQLVAILAKELKK